MAKDGKIIPGVSRIMTTIRHSIGFMDGGDVRLRKRTDLTGGRPSTPPGKAKLIAEVIDDFYNHHLTNNDHWPLLEEIASMLIKEGIVV